jgi:transposase/transposase-like protein
MRAEAIVRLSQGLTLQQVADEFDAHLNSVEKWRQRWNKAGLIGLYEGYCPGRPQYRWLRIGQPRCVEPQSHNQRVNVLRALRHDGKLIWDSQQRPTARNDVIAFFDRLSEQPHSVPCIVVLDNAGIHKGEIMESKRLEWAKRGLYLYYLLPYSPELNQIEILWKQAKYFWRRFVTLKGIDLLNEVNSIMNRFGTDFTIRFA